MIDKKLDESKTQFPYGEYISKRYGSLDLEVDECKAFVSAFLHTPNSTFTSALLKNVQPPAREVEDFAIFHIRRDHFQGEAAIRIVEQVLHIDTSQDPIYNFKGRRDGFSRGPGGSRMGAADTGLRSG